MEKVQNDVDCARFYQEYSVVNVSTIKGDKSSINELLDDCLFIIILANTGSSKPPMLTPSICSYSWLLQENAVLVQVSRSNLRSVDFLIHVSISFLL